MRVEGQGSSTAAELLPLVMNMHLHHDPCDDQSEGERGWGEGVKKMNVLLTSFYNVMGNNIRNKTCWTMRRVRVSCRVSINVQYDYACKAPPKSLM